MQATGVIARLLLSVVALALAAVVLIVAPGADAAAAVDRCSFAPASGALQYPAGSATAHAEGVGTWAEQQDASGTTGWQALVGQDGQNLIDLSNPYLEFCVRAPSSGFYKMVATVSASDSTSDSFFVKVGANPNRAAFIFDTGSNPARNETEVAVSARVVRTPAAACSSGLGEVVDRTCCRDQANPVDDCPFTIYLDEGAQTIRFYPREAGTVIHGLRLEDSSDKPNVIFDIYPGDDIQAILDANHREDRVGIRVETFRFHPRVDGVETVYDNAANIRPHEGQRLVGLVMGGRRPVLDGSGLADGVRAFRGSANNVDIIRLDITGYTPGKYQANGTFGLKQAPISPDDGANRGDQGENWLILDNHIHDNHGVGVRLATGMLVVDNEIYNNREPGISSTGRKTEDVNDPTRVRDVQIVNNLISGNSQGAFYEYDAAEENDGDDRNGGYTFTHHDAGIKVTYVTGLSVRRNVVTNNRGVGIYCDLFCSDVTITKNTVHNNGGGETDRFGAGIFLELAENATVSENAICAVGLPTTRKFWGPVVVAESKDVTIANNDISGSNYADSNNGALLRLRNGTALTTPALQSANARPEVFFDVEQTRRWTQNPATGVAGLGFDLDQIRVTNNRFSSATSCPGQGNASGASPQASWIGMFGPVVHDGQKDAPLPSTASIDFSSNSYCGIDGFRWPSDSNDGTDVLTVAEWQDLPFVSDSAC